MNRMTIVFQYGSNCFSTRLNSPDRLNGDAVFLGRADLEGYRLVFDVWSDGNACAASDIIESPGHTVQGVLYEVPDFLMSRTTTPPGRRSFDSVEGSRYERHNVSVHRRVDASIMGAITYVAKASDRQQGIRTSFAYVEHIIRGLRESGADPKYIEEIKREASESNPAIANDIARL
jgi:hypothetical protein